MTGEAPEHALHRLLDAARDWHASLPALTAFTPWPEDLLYRPRPPLGLPHLSDLAANPGQATAHSQPLRDAILAAAPHIEWRHTYTEAEVGRDFLDRYGWFELAGPDGHFITSQTRLTVGYWGPGLAYDWHQHPAEELYSVVAGGGLFRVANEKDRLLGPGDTRHHAGHQRHALDTSDQPLLAFILWRGDGLDDPPRMSR